MKIYELVIEPGREEHIARDQVSTETPMTRKEQQRFPKNRIPTFKTIEEEAAFWDTHSSEEFADELTSVENVKFVKAQPKKALTVRFDEDTFEELTREAREKGIGPSTLARMVILEHIRARRRAS